MSKKNSVVSEEVAQTDVDRMIDAMGVVTVDEILDADAVENYAANIHRLKHAIMKGSLVITDSGEPTYKDSKGGEYTFKEPLGGVYLAPVKKNAPEMTAVYNYATEMTQGKCLPGKLPMRDVRVIMSLVGLFMAM